MASLSSARIRAKFPLDETVVDVWAGSKPCWSCGRETRFISGVRVNIGKCGTRFNLAELGEFEGLFETLCAPLEAIIVKYRIARRPGLARDRWCLSNGCTHCGAFIGEYDDFDETMDEERVHSFRLPFTETWRRALLEEDRERRLALAPRWRRRPVGEGANGS